MIDFSKYSAEQIVHFVDENFSLFSLEKNDKFPENIINQISGNLFHVANRKEGFALVAKGLNSLFGGDGKNAELMFLYVQPEFQRNGIGAKLVDEAKSCLPEGRTMEVKCEGSKRMRFFERMGFVLAEYHHEFDQYNLEWKPQESST